MASVTPLERPASAAPASRIPMHLAPPPSVREVFTREVYVPVQSKFAVALSLAIVWTALSVWLSQPWLHDLAAVVGMPLALFVISFVAYVPGLGVERELADVQAAFVAAEVEAAEAHGATQRQAIYSQQMKHLAHTDELTGLANRRAFMARWQAALLRAEQSGESIGLLLIDADRFKSINDSGGHAMGDIVLRAIGASLQKAAHPSDIVARLGGDEFAIFTTQAESARLQHLAEAIRLEFGAAAGVLAVDTTLSIGMASSLDCSRENLLHDADVALYRSKEAGGDCAHLYECPAEAAVNAA